jgi:hypothetical protein
MNAEGTRAVFRLEGEEKEAAGEDVIVFEKKDGRWFLRN